MFSNYMSSFKRSPPTVVHNSHPRLDDDDEEHSYFGKKYIGVGQGGTLEIFGEKKLAWTFLNKTLHPEKSNQKSYLFHRSWGNRGIILHVIDPTTGDVLHSDRFDTYQGKTESCRLAKFVNDIKAGLILCMMVNDEGSNNLEDSAKKILSRLGSNFISNLGFRDPWTFIVKKGHPSSAVEDHTVYKGPKESSKAQSSFQFQSSSGEYFTITSNSQWAQEAEWTDWFDRDDERGSGDWEKLFDLRKAYPDQLCSDPLDIQVQTHDGIPFNQTGDVIYKISKDYGFVCLNKDQIHGLCHNYQVRFLCGKLVRPEVFLSIDMLTDNTILELSDEVVGWRTGDQVVVASTDYSMHQAEEFTLLPCPTCMSNQVKIKGRAKFIHIGEEVDGVDMRAEVGLLTRNILLRGETEPTCYGHEACKFFDFDTFGGHLKVQRRFKAVHISGLELQYMGQQTMGHYPVHFHMNGDVDEKGGYSPPTFVSDLSIHHSFSRCVTIHGSNGLLVKDVVGYETLGHCFFTEDGPEERNTFYHCLGLMIRAGTLLPSDRDSKMCRAITDGAYPGYVANPRQDCSASSTFWIANPNNNLINCAAAGSEETGFWFIFHHVPTGASEGLYSPGHTEHTPMGQFTNNRAHSNYRAGMILDNGVKTTEANDKDKRPFLSLIGARYSPHQDADLFKPRVPAIISHFIAYKNQDHGAWLRGGDVWLDGCQFADNGIGLTLASGGTFPDDDGSHQQVKNSLFVGESGNRGTLLPDNNIWGPGGSDFSSRTLPRGIDFPIRGMQIYDGPVNVQNCTFRKFAALHGRHTSAFGFRLNNSWQSCPKNYVTNITFDQVPVSFCVCCSLIFLKLKANNEREQFAFCSVKGCERVKITATIPEGSPPSNCLAKAYPIHAETPVANAAMPKKIPKSRLLSSEHFLEIKVESYITRFFHIKEDFAFVEVNGKKWYQQEDGVQLTVIDGHDGNVVESKGFRNSILQSVPAQLENYVNGLKDGSLMKLSCLSFAEKLAFVGFKGSFYPDWVKLEISSDQAKIHQVLPVPIVYKFKL
ncbi:cell migration-inducing and hyaluronan-binding protein [Poecilia formosa]|uniref:cell migration-inducing and hyaluronan-binding protein n=2 Tax=Poecilia TaxID=8080 RepID=UPI0007BA5090|nr:PREDICTED: cell migration-inducing and hyaluronan-binding protein [Poecilia formosa]